MFKQKVQKLGLYEDKTKYEKLCEELSDIFAEFTEVPPKRDPEHYIELIDSSKPPPKPPAKVVQA